MDVEAMPIPLLVDLVNGWGTVPRARGGDRDRPPVAELVERHAVADPLATLFNDGALERVADALHPVFSASEPAERVALASALLAKSRVQPALAYGLDGIQATWRVRREDAALLAAAATALRSQLADFDPERLGVCASGGCADVFVDVSPRAHRRFCSVTCQNRERVAAFRRRRSAAT
jgi:hypothetical protein